MLLYPVQQHCHSHNKELHDLFKQTSLLQSNKILCQLMALVPKWMVNPIPQFKDTDHTDFCHGIMFISGTHNFCSICLRLLYQDIHHIFRGVICHAHCQLLHHHTLMIVAIPEAAANTLPSRFHTTSKCLVKTLETSTAQDKKSASHYQCLLWQLHKCCPHTLVHSIADDAF